MLFDEFSEERRIGEIQHVADFLDAEIGFEQQMSDAFCQLFPNPFGRALACFVADNDRKIFGGDTESVGIVLYAPFFQTVLGQKDQEALGDGAGRFIVDGVFLYFVLFLELQADTDDFMDGSVDKQLNYAVAMIVFCSCQSFLYERPIAFQQYPVVF